MEATRRGGLEWKRGSLIGRGGCGSVFLARSNNSSSFLPPLFAVKSAEVSDSDSLHKETEILINLQRSPYIIRCFGNETTTGKGGDTVFNLFMEYASGGSLASLIEKSNGLPEREVRRYSKHLLLGLLHIHDSGYVHCDIKPDNVLLVPSRHSGTYIAKIADFGLSKRRKSDPNLRGTPLYLSPESIVDGLQEAPSDIWALGCVVLEMLTRKPPWDSDPNWTSEELLVKIADYWVLPNIPRGISNDARSFLKACLVRKPRFRITAEMLLQHPFVSGCEDEDDLVDEEAEEEEEEKFCFFF